MKKYISILLVTCLIISMLPIFSITSYADVPATQKVTAHNGSWGSYDFTYVMHSKYYKIQDDTGIPTSTLLNPQYFYTNDDVTFNSVSGSDLFVLILNRGLGLILDPDNISTYINAFFNAIGPNHLDTTDSKYVQGGLYNSNDEFLGYCLDDISGCYWNTIQDTRYTVPKEQIDNVDNFIDYYDANSYPDFFTFYPLSNTYILNNINKSQEIQNNISTFLEDKDLSFYINKAPNAIYYSITSVASSNNNIVESSTTPIKYAVQGSGFWNDMCQIYNLHNDNELLGSDMYSNDNVSGNKFIYLDLYDNGGNKITSFTTYNTTNGTTTTRSDSIIYFGLYSQSHYSFYNVDSLTIYKNTQVVTDLNNQTYYPSSYITDSYNQDNTDLSTTISQTLNSVTYNNQIYNDSNDSFYNYYDNGYYDTSSSSTNITNITNNYYNSGDDPDDPNDPDDPDDNQTLDAILSAILRFFNAIGDIIGTILAGLVNMISAVLEALAGIMEDLTGITDFFGSLFTWLPDPVPQIIAAGISLTILAGIIKFIRG